MLGAGGIAIAAAIGLSTYALTLGGNAGDVAQEHSGGPLVAGSLCRASQLSTSASFGAATGSDLGGATITNTSGTACTLPNGRPAVLIRWRGRELPARQELPPKSRGDRAVHVLAPNGRAIVRMQWFEWCGAPGETTVFRPTFLMRFRGLDLAARAQLMSPPRCDPGTGGAFIYVSRPLVDS